MMSLKGNTSAIAYLGMMTAAAAVLSYVEALIPLTPALPGIKPGLSNIVITAVLYSFGTGAAFGVSLARILIVGFLFGNMSSILYSLTGTVSAIVIMEMLRRTGLFSVFGVSAAGGAAHNFGQLLAAFVLLPEMPLMDYLPYLLLAGLAAGMLTGALLLFLKPYLAWIETELEKRISERTQ